MAADGLVMQGSGSLDESALTGEALPIKIKAGDRVRSGTSILQGSLHVKAEGVGDNSTIGQMIQVMESALGRKTPLEGKTDRILQWFVPLILLLAFGTGAGCLVYGLSLETAMIRAVTVMVIACPCSLGIAIPLARVAGISLAGKKGILVRNFRGLEQADQITAFVFDKTGTMTYGQWDLLNMIAIEPFREHQILSWAVSLERDADHYIATAIRRQAEKKNIKAIDMERIAHFENGIRGYVQNNAVKIGSKDFLLPELKAPTIRQLKHIDSDDIVRSFVYMSFSGRLCGVLIFGDQIKPEALNLIEQLNARGHLTYLVSGDGDKTTKTVGDSLKAHQAYGGMPPQAKVRFIEKLQHAGMRVAMTGDGINDAPALIQSDLSMAVHSGSHLGREVADITLMRSDPLQIMDFLDLAKRVNKKIFQNLACSFFYNIISIPIALSGLLNPLIAVCAMLLSSLSVIANTLLISPRLQPGNSSYKEVL
ncbi:heavy metal translocating P-type ATPase [Thermodesulfobacteriota bacterium]